MNSLVISFIGPDRLGLVDILSNTVQQHNGNWQTSSMHHLSGFFAGVIEVSVAAAQTSALSNALSEIPDLNCQIETSSTDKNIRDSNLLLDLTANDRAGIVQDISSVIHRQGGNLVELVSIQQSAAHSGQTMFIAKAKISVNEHDIESLIGSLENIADDLMVDVSR
jgi:glycine cleavage system regulatory protein